MSRDPAVALLAQKIFGIVACGDYAVLSISIHKIVAVIAVRLAEHDDQSRQQQQH